MKMPVTTVPTLEFTYKDNRGVSLPGTLAGLVPRLPAYWRGLRQLRNLVRETAPDVILNFFEPLTGVYALTTRRRPPVVAIGHQFMFEHPAYIRAPGLRTQQWGMKWFTRLVGAASARVALSLYEAPDLPGKNLVVCPPILRRQLFELPPDAAGNFVLIYLLNHGYADQIIRWHEAHPHLALHCFYDKPGAPAEDRRDATLTFHQLDGEKFLRLMGACKYVVCTAGFESLCEAAYLGKPLFMIPVENHVEQQINALDAVQTGLGVTDRTFNLDRLAELPERLDNAAFRAWVDRAGTVLLQAITRAAKP
jgi:uncharacterized protein (TIGR00661 family)